MRQAALPFDSTTASSPPPVIPSPPPCEHAPDAGRQHPEPLPDRAVSVAEGSEQAVTAALVASPLAAPVDAPVGEPEFVRSPRARRYIIRVRPDLSVRVTVPRSGSRRDALAFVERQQEWIARQRERIVAERRRQPAAVLPPDEQRELQARARRELPRRLLALAAAFDLPVRKISIRNQRWRWGSCSRDGHICLNWRLIAMPDWVCDYVLIHELMHLKRMDHSPRFWKLVAAACPTFREARAWLRANQRLLDSRV